MTLRRSEWEILEGISYDSEEPFEVVDAIVHSQRPEADPYDTLQIIFDLYKQGWVHIKQIPIKAFNQDANFSKKEIAPEKAADMVRILFDSFQEYCRKRQYLSQMRDAGVPFGLYIGLTEKARHEISKPEYSDYEARGI